ncbi:hypothetical protein HN51_051760 [Arachis hypogaea]
MDDAAAPNHLALLDSCIQPYPVRERVTRSDLKRLLSDLESRKNFHINFVTVRKLTSKADAFEYADQVLERWYPSIEEGNNKGIVVLVTSQKEGAITGGPAFVQAVGEKSAFVGGKASEGVFVGAFLSMSSTAVVLKFLMDKNTINALHGQVTIGTLILQVHVIVTATTIQR